MKKASVVLIGILLFIVTLVGCSKLFSKALIFKGESEDWKADFRVYNIETSTNEDGNDVYTADKTLTVTYKNDLADLATVKTWEISYESVWYGGKQSETLTNNSSITDKVFTINCGGGQSDLRIENKDNVIKVSVNIDGEIQNLELKSD
ncbi:MAG: hypothetical protein K0S01_1242 [Herbinix sp.]|jgi:hypothetical protein|nr:hypothetical protein [Herbinix sp.]